jgi:ParB/RepB/Spo0J family partition protein
MPEQVQHIQTDHLVDPYLSLRAVNRQSVEYLELETSISEHGFLCSISVRPCPDKPGYYEVVDGMYRLACARALCLPTVPCIIKEGLTDENVLTLQIGANAIRPHTKPCEFARQLMRIQKAHPGITLRRLGSMVNKNLSWVQRQLGLLKLPEEAQQMVDRGEIPIGNAHQLSKIPSHLQDNYIGQARSLSVPEFGRLAADVLKRYREAKVKGRRDVFYSGSIAPVAHLRTLNEVEAEHRDRLMGPLVATAMGCKTPLDGWYAALLWLMHLDPESVKERERIVMGRQRQYKLPSEGITD